MQLVRTCVNVALQLMITLHHSIKLAAFSKRLLSGSSSYDIAPKALPSPCQQPNSLHNKIMLVASGLLCGRQRAKSGSVTDRTSPDTGSASARVQSARVLTRDRWRDGGLRLPALLSLAGAVFRDTGMSRPVRCGSGRHLHPSCLTIPYPAADRSGPYLCPRR